MSQGEKKQHSRSLNLKSIFVHHLNLNLTDRRLQMLMHLIDHILDLEYQEDCTAQVDMNIIMTESGKMIEVQGTAEGFPFSRSQLDELLDLGEKGVKELTQFQKQALA